MTPTAPTRQLVAAFSLAATGVLAQGQPDPAGTYSEYLEVQLVSVELFATDRSGRPVLDLEVGEIEVLEDGKPVEISHFAPPAATAAEAGAPGPALAARGGGSHAERPPVKLAIFVDNLNTGPASRARLLEQVREVIDHGLGPRDEVMVASFDGMLKIEEPFTTNRRKLKATLDRVEDLTGDRMMAGLRSRRALDRIQWETESNADGPCVYVGDLAREHADEMNHDVQRTLAALEQFVASLAGVPGRKALVHVSDGIPLIPGAEAWNHAISLCDGTGENEALPGAAAPPAYMDEGIQNRFDPKKARLDMLSYDTTEQWRRLAAQAAAQRVVFYPFYAAGLTVSARSEVMGVRSTFRTEMETANNQQDTLSILADETGGQAFFNTNDFRPAIRRVVDESLASYELAYISPAAGDEKLHEIKVRVSRPGVRVRYRKSYQAKTVQQRVEDGVLSALFYGLEQNPLEVRIETDDVETRIVGGRAKVPIRILLPLDRLTLLPEGGDKTGLFTVFIAAQHAFGEMTRVGHRSIPVTITQEKLAASQGQFEYVVEMDLGLGRNQVAVALRDEIGGVTSYVTSVVELSG